VGRLDAVDLDQKLPRKRYEQELDHAQRRLVQVRLALGGQLGDRGIGPGLLVLFEGWDAAGKGGAIRHLVERLDPRHVTVHQFAGPTLDEKRHHFLARFWPAIPGRGGMRVLDRSWYGRVLVERVEGFATEDEWRRAYATIRDFESSLLAEGVILVKLWLHTSDDEQLARFHKREADPLKRWKLTDEDWRNREKRAAYEEAVEDMLRETDTADAPWHVIPGDSKRFARVEVIRTVTAEVERACAERGFPLPAPLDPLPS
jgi:polyphosphate kinase 2 (PPK2 family)